MPNLDESATVFQVPPPVNKDGLIMHAGAGLPLDKRYCRDAVRCKVDRVGVPLVL